MSKKNEHKGTNPKPEWKDDKGKFLPSNQYWTFRDKHGRDYEYKPEELWEQFIEYVKWMTDNPLYEEKAFGTGYIHRQQRPRAMTIQSFCLFADIDHTTFQDYEKNSDFSTVTKRIRDSIFSQKFELAASEFVNPNLIARETGISEKYDVNLPKGLTIEVPDEETKKELEELKNILNSKDEGN